MISTQMNFAYKTIYHWQIEVDDDSTVAYLIAYIANELIFVICTKYKSKRSCPLFPLYCSNAYTESVNTMSTPSVTSESELIIFLFSYNSHCLINLSCLSCFSGKSVQIRTLCTLLHETNFTSVFEY